MLPLPNDGTYTYRYRQSIYDVPVVEELRASDGRVHVVRVRSSDRRSLEYYRWSDDISPDGDAFVQEAPDIAMLEVSIRVTRAGEQALGALGTTVPLRERFGEEVLRVEPASTTRLEWLVARLATEAARWAR